MVNQLNGGNERVILQSATEQTKFHGMIIAKVHSSIATIAALFRLVHNCLRRMLITISCRPTVHGVFRTTRKFQKLVPMMFHEIQDSGDHLVLSLLAIGKSVAVYMEMQTAG